jgi:hypothetical protein
MLPPPRTTSSTGSSARAQIVSLVRYAASARPGTGGTAGDAPVARTARRKVIVRPSTSTVDGPVNLASPVRTLTPSRARACGESTGAIRLAAAWTWAITAGRSTRTPSTWTPNRCAVRAAAADRAAARIAFDGTHPVHRQSPPGRSRSTSRTLAPTLAAVLAATTPAVPPPTTTRSHGLPGCAGGLTGGPGPGCAGRTRATGRPRRGRGSAGPATATVRGAAPGARRRSGCTSHGRRDASPDGRPRPGARRAAGSASR